MGKAAKGSDFERELCRRLSRWWTGGERDDIFWRTSQSGGRATQRSKKDLKTFGSYGDIAAVDPIGQPLMKMFTIELKRGSSYGTPGDLLDFKPINSKHPWVVCLEQAIRSHEQAGSLAWMMICRRDHRLPVVFLESRIFKWLRDGSPVVGSVNFMRFSLAIREEKGYLKNIFFSGIPLEFFLASVLPRQIIHLVKSKSYK